MITGFNTDVEHSGVVYHVQTEDKGVRSPLILSLVYVGGTILASKRTPYDDLIEAGYDEKVLAERLQRQHKLICAAIRAGRIEDLKRQTERESGARSKTTEQPQEETTQPEAPEEDFIILHGNIADFMPPSSFMSPPESQTEEQPVEPPAPEVTSAPVVQEAEHVDYSHVIDYSQTETIESDLQISLLEEKKFIAGEYVKVLLRVARGWNGSRSVAGASVTLKVLGSTFRPLIFTGKTANDGTVVFYALLPYFTSGRAAILASVMDDGEKAELRRVVHQP